MRRRGAARMGRLRPEVVLLALALSACGGGDAGSQASSVPTSVTTAAEATTTSEATPVVLTLGPGDFNMENPRLGLNTLGSFVATLTMSFEGTRDSQPNSWSVVYEMHHRADPLATVIAVESSGDITLDGPSFVLEAEGVRYETTPDGTCTGSRVDADDQLLEWLEPAGRIDALFGAEAAGQDTINGIAVEHFTFDERAVGLYGLAETSGELWVAAEGGYVLRYQRATTGDAEYFGDGIEGTLVWDYALVEVNQPIDVVFPPGCRVELPMLADASNVLNLPGWLAFDTAASAAEVADFYQQELLAIGWSVVLAPEPADTVAVLQFTLGDENLFIAVGPGDSGSRVDIIIQPAIEE